MQPSSANGSQTNVSMHSSINSPFIMCQEENIQRVLLRLKTDEKQTSPPPRSLPILPHLFWLGPLQPALTYIPPCCTPASAQSAPEALSNCLYPLQKRCCCSSRLQRKSPSPPASQPYFSPHYTLQLACVCYFHLCVWL